MGGPELSNGPSALATSATRRPSLVLPSAAEIASGEVGQFVLSAASGAVVALAGIDGESLRSIIDATGMIFATQLPRGIDHAIVSNCTTQLYGRMSAPATIQATQELMAAKGGAAEDIGRLKSGEFYFSTEGLVRPVKVKTPLCLSWHPANPPTAEEVVRKAAEKRE
jgi:hypothetical protein